MLAPGQLSLVAGLDQTVAAAPANAKTTQRRLQLANWIVDPKNPLTPRVLVNRLWMFHFGQGLVRSPNNFGFKGVCKLITILSGLKGLRNLDLSHNKLHEPRNSHSHMPTASDRLMSLTQLARLDMGTLRSAAG